jgi:hypothetical protein
MKSQFLLGEDLNIGFGLPIKIFESYWAIVCEVADGKIKYFRGFEDTGALEASFRGD